MEHKQFIKIAEDLIYKEVAKNTNLLLGKNKTAGLSTGLFLKLPIEVKLNKSNEPLPKLDKSLESMASYFGAYVMQGNSTTVYFTFMYHDDKDLDAIEKHLHRHGTFFAFVYMHEIQHILRKHITKSYNTMMLRIAGNMRNPEQLINIAEDYAINYSLKDLFTGSPLAQKWKEIENIGLYNADYHKEQLSDIDILKDLISKGKEPECTNLSDSMCNVSIDGKTSVQPIEGNGNEKSSEEDGEGSSPKKEDKTSTASDDMDTAMSDLAESIKDVIQSNTKGTTAGELFADLFESIKVETGWFKKIKASFKRKVYYMTHDYSTSWASLNNTYRRIYKSPKKEFIDTKLEVVLSVDHSGSVSTEALQRLLYLMEDTAKQISKLTVLIHDTRIVKEFIVESDFDISENKDFKEALATRYVVGGTSHSDVFNWLDKNIKTLDKSIFISFSDNYSDIPQEWAKHPKLRKLTTYFVCCVPNNPMNVPGAVDIAMV
jgi:hypothetical protein